MNPTTIQSLRTAALDTIQSLRTAALDATDARKKAELVCVSDKSETARLALEMARAAEKYAWSKFNETLPDP